MDRVTFSLQNKELIEQVIKDTPELQVAIPNAIIDKVSKRVIKNVMNSSTVNDAIRKAVDEAENYIKEHYLNKEKSSCGYSTYYVLKDKYKDAICKAVNNVFEKEIDKQIKNITDTIVDKYQKELDEELNIINMRIKKYDEAYLDNVIKDVITNIVEKRFGGK